MTADKQFSIYVSKTLDCLGYNQDMFKYRVKHYRERQEYLNIIEKRRSKFDQVIAGSKAEGLTSIFESDCDFMIVFSDVICAENVRPFIHNSNTIVFETDRHDSPAGYTKLKHVKYKDLTYCSVINYSLLDDESKDKYLSNDVFVTTMVRVILKDSNVAHTLHARSGPSLEVASAEGYIHEDKVFALRCVCSRLLQSFLTRPRPYNRPSLNELRDISVMDAHVVPVGNQGSNESHLEWRICFTKAELYLVQRLNETGTKLYILLKMVSKLLKIISKDITSYVMKNIVLWLVELYPIDLFSEYLLTFQLIKALRFLHTCVEVNFLPSYMIPERNLLSNRLNRIERLKLNTFLSTLIQEGGYLLLRCEKLRDGMVIMYREPDMAEEFRTRRDMCEKIFLLENKIRYEKMAATGLSLDGVKRLLVTDGTKGKIKTLVIHTIIPDLVLLYGQGNSAEALSDVVNERRVQLLL